MKQLLCIFATASVIVLSSTGYTENNRTPHLDGLEDKILMNEGLVNLTVGALKFMRESEHIRNTKLKDITPNNGDEFDFIIIGAGSAGATIASRLSEALDVTVLLIEAGRSENYMMDIPLLVNYLQFVDAVNWKYQTEPSTTYCQGMTDRKCNWPRGKVMGGSSVLNYMIATRGDPRDYDEWSSMGNDGWSYSELLKYFKKLETIGIDKLRYDQEMHNTNGPVYIGYPPYHTPLAKGFLDAGREMGYPIIDYNGNQHTGFSYIQATIKNGTRMSTNRAYLYPLKRRKNLFVTKLSHVNKILIDPKNKRAYGVDFTKSGVDIQVRASKEIISCAGTIGSPQILMLSGIGPSEHLKEMNINVIQNSPVGENLMDHIAYGGLVFLIDQPLSITSDEMSNPMKPHIREFLNKKTGPLTVPGGCEALAFVDIDKSGALDVYPNIELLFIGGSIVSDLSFRKSFGISEEYWTMFSNVTGHHSWTIFPMLMRPKSRGKILLRDNDPKSKPKIFANYLDDPEDVRVLVKGIRASIELSRTKSMQKFQSEFYNITVPGCEHYENDSDEYWECAVRAFTFTIYHYTGTCKMAPESDPTGVVNPRLQVKNCFNFNIKYIYYNSR